MIKTLNNTIKQDRTAYKIPRSVQDVIPIQRIFADGIFQFGTKYSRTLRFSDINYAIASKEDKTAMFLGYSELLNALDSGSTGKVLPPSSRSATSRSTGRLLKIRFCSRSAATASTDS